MLVGTGKFIARARHLRKMLGGGMRQVGVIAAAGLISIEKMTNRLGDDHVHAKKLADGLRQIDGIMLDEGSPLTNMIYFTLAESIKMNAPETAQKMKEHGVLIDPDDWRRFRLVTHYWIDDDAVEKTVSAFKKVLS